MKVALVHNRYRLQGGEDQVLAAEAALLTNRGHRVTQYVVSNDEVSHYGRLALAKAAIWNSEQYQRTRALFDKLKPDVVHVHNTLPLISPAVFYAARAARTAIVHTLHNYRMMCVNGLLFRDGHICEDCLGKRLAWRGVVHRCYRNSHLGSAVVAAMLGYHRMRGTYQDQIDAYIALTNFARDKFLSAGLPAEKLFVKPNFLAEDPGVGTGRGNYALFVGRLSAEKGIGALLAAWKHIGSRLPLRIAGDGPLANAVASAQESGNISWLGWQPREHVLALMRSATILMFPSAWYEGFPMTLVEALATGTPVVATRTGALGELVIHGRTGLTFDTDNIPALVRVVNWAIEHPSELATMRLAARSEYEDKYTDDTNFGTLQSIYSRAIEARNHRVRA